MTCNVLANAKTRDVQERCIDALITKTQILWALLDAVTTAHPLVDTDSD